MESWSFLEARYDALEPREARNAPLEVLEARSGNGALLLDARNDALEARGSSKCIMLASINLVPKLTPKATPEMIPKGRPKSIPKETH